MHDFFLHILNIMIVKYINELKIFNFRKFDWNRSFPTPHVPIFSSGRRGKQHANGGSRTRLHLSDPFSSPLSLSQLTATTR